MRWAESLSIYVNDPDWVPKKKTWGMPKNDLYLISDRIGHAGAKIIIYLSCNLIFTMTRWLSGPSGL